MDIDEAMRAIDRPYYGKPEDVEPKENGSCKFKETDTLPFGMSWHYNDAKILRDAADAFGCSVDYLLCRTDVPNLGTVAMPESWVPLQWIDGREKPTAKQWAVAIFKLSGLKKPWKRIAYWNGTAWVVDKMPVDDPCLQWFPIPDDEGVCG